MVQFFPHRHRWLPLHYQRREKNCGAANSFEKKRTFERCCLSSVDFKQSMQHGLDEREARHLHITVQRPGVLIYLPHLLPRTVLTLDAGSPTTLSRWDAATTKNNQMFVQTLDEYNFGVHRGQFFVENFIRNTGMGAFSCNK